VNAAQATRRWKQSSDAKGSGGNFRFNGVWRGRGYAMKQVEAIAIFEEDDWLVLTVVVRYF
jgi:hypothetical protein